jgi:hypothetical protein
MGNTESMSTNHSIKNESNGNKQRRSVKLTSSSNSKKSSIDELNSETTDPFIFQVCTVVDDIQAGLVGGIRELEELDHPGAALLDSMCGPYLDSNNIYNGKHLGSSYSEDMYDNSVEDEHDCLAVSEEETTVTTDSHNQRSSIKNNNNENKGKNNHSHSRREEDETITIDSRSYVSCDSPTLPPPRYVSSNNNNANKTNANCKSICVQRTCRSNRIRYESSIEETDDNIPASEITTAASADEDYAVLVSSKLKSSFYHKDNAANTAATTSTSAALISQSKRPLQSGFSKRCFFTKNKIGGRTQHYEGLTLTGNVIFMLASAMKLKCCPTICDQDLRRVEQKYPNQFSRLPAELLLSCGWRRTSKYCFFSNKPIPDGLPFFRAYLIFPCMYFLCCFG